MIDLVMPNKKGNRGGNDDTYRVFSSEQQDIILIMDQLKRKKQYPSVIDCFRELLKLGYIKKETVEDAESEFSEAIQKFRELNDKHFPSFTDCLWVIKQLGYLKDGKEEEKIVIVNEKQPSGNGGKLSDQYKQKDPTPGYAHKWLSYPNKTYSEKKKNSASGGCWGCA
jgi:hypothetical protein